MPFRVRLSHFEENRLPLSLKADCDVKGGIIDLFPVGVWQFMQTLDHGLWYARSQEFIRSAPFQTLTWLRVVGGVWFTLGGVVPMIWFMLSRWRALKQSPPINEEASHVMSAVIEQHAIGD